MIEGVSMEMLGVMILVAGTLALLDHLRRRLNRIEKMIRELHSRVGLIDETYYYGMLMADYTKRRDRDEAAEQLAKEEKR